MLVQCPSCHTTYRVSDSLITTPNPTFRCSRCKHIFVLGLRPEASPVRETTTAPSTTSQEEEERELSFSFPPPEKKEVREEKSEEGLGPHMLREQPPPTTDEEQLSPLTDNSFTIPEEDRSLQIDSATEATPEFEEEWQDSSPVLEEREPITALYPDQDRPVSTLPYISLFGVLLLIYSLLTLMHQAQPRTLETFLKTIPWLGSSVFKNNHLRQGIVLQSLRPSFQKILGKRKVFVISGVAINRNPVSVREVRVEGHIFNAEGKEIEHQAISVGNAISSKIIRDLTAQEISILQKLNPQKRFEIPPQESAGFVIVFLKPSGEIKDFSCRVLSAEEA